MQKTFKFLCKRTKPSARAHIWTGTDTACRMASTGGLGAIRGYEVSRTAAGRKICQNCRVCLATMKLKNHQQQRPTSLSVEKQAIDTDAAALWIIQQEARSKHAFKVAKDKTISQNAAVQRRVLGRDLMVRSRSYVFRCANCEKFGEVVETVGVKDQFPKNHTCPSCGSVVLSHEAMRIPTRGDHAP